MKFIIIVAIITGVYVVGMDLVKKYTNTIDFSQVVNTPKNIVVQITGEVANPGVYEMKEGATLAELINMAGGVTENANTSSINYTRVLADATRYTIKAKSEPAPTLVNINTATVALLTTVPGIGVTIASRIVAYRIEHGYFTSVDQLCEVKGIKDAMLEKIRTYVTVE